MIPWYIYAFIAVISETLFLIARKKALLKVHAMNFEAARSLSVVAYLLIFLPFINLKLSFNTLALVYFISWVSILGILLMSKALKHKDISSMYPLANLKPAFVAVLAFLFLAESIHPIQIVGIGIILISAYMLEADHHFSDFLRPFREIASSKYNLYFIIAIILFSATTVLDKYVISFRTDMFSYIFWVWIFVAINFNLVHGIEFGFGETLSCFKKTHLLPLLVGGLSVVNSLFVLKALSLAYTSLVTAVLMLTTLLVVFFGGRFFHEKNLMYRVLISAFMIIGVYLVVV